MITDEMVEKALNVWGDRMYHERETKDCMRAALEAVAPALMKQGAYIVCDLYEARCRIGKAEPWTENYSHMYARAQELDPQ
jgi:hypothetical protein